MSMAIVSSLVLSLSAAPAAGTELWQGEGAPCGGSERAAPCPEPEEPQIATSMLHGFRIGGLYVNRHENVRLPSGKSLRSPFMFVIGYEIFYRIESGAWLDVLVVANGMLSGLEQNLVVPSANFLIGFELDRQFQVGVGPHLRLPGGEEEDEVKLVHVAFALGWTPKVGAFHVPVHFFLIPDVDREHRIGATVGVNW